MKRELFACCSAMCWALLCNWQDRCACLWIAYCLVHLSYFPSPLQWAILLPLQHFKAQKHRPIHSSLVSFVFKRKVEMQNCSRELWGKFIGVIMEGQPGSMKQGQHLLESCRFFFFPSRACPWREKVHLNDCSADASKAASLPEKCYIYLQPLSFQVGF